MRPHPSVLTPPPIELWSGLVGAGSGWVLIVRERVISFLMVLCGGLVRRRAWSAPSCLFLLWQSWTFGPDALALFTFLCKNQSLPLRSNLRKVFKLG